ncbi:hypothetical protein B6N60_04974 [Richelia sinica FACHB-800]|uniref:Uncharacterized protein n=1 Tax=Richelia sinica FACHB-800 TaxID=1357546 RepID=A0A975TDR4_9NOST|nr:hypothetical protein B6N60_04974 [Richelia sinica FACHB-800]
MRANVHGTQAIDWVVSRLRSKHMRTLKNYVGQRLQQLYLL